MNYVINNTKVLEVKYEGKPCYDIVFEQNFNELKERLETLNIKNKKVMVVSETNVAPHYMSEVKEIVKSLQNNVFEFVFEAGEASKNLDTVSRLYEELIINKFDRKDILIALGGGVVGDLTGFTASTYLRGIDFIQIPTTLLSQVDSSVGGKTGVDFKAYKNMVGAFYQPKLVYINTSTLNTLPDREFFSGMAEVIKYGVIKKREYFDWLVENAAEIKNRNQDLLEKMIFVSCDTKREVVEKDPKEKGERALLNFGHTIGHAVEKEKNFDLLHGECISIGMYAAAFLCLDKGYINQDTFNRLKECLVKYELPITTDQIDVDSVAGATLNDKKMSAGVIKFISFDSIGNAFIDTSVTMEEMKNAISKIIC
ncbi:MAG: 3-dehydroquinate synthase [Lachnospiraceae bacterium]|nr:3-dehydroquinate synthase [Lachnospiraceae bacterium]